ncbi:MAG: type II toxin-antitoxin system RelE/ParE family toxin [Bacteroidota bacterium]
MADRGLKPVEWARPALHAARALPSGARRELGFQLDRVQRGLNPNDFKPIKAVGAGVYEIRVRDEGRAFRSFYVARFDQAVYVLHVFEKKTRKTLQADLDLGRSRYRALLRQRD